MTNEDADLTNPSPDGLPNHQLFRVPLYRQISNNIQKWIFSGGLVPGDRLPSERDLCERFGVSRAVIREAVRALSARGLVKVLPGSGIFVKRITVEDLSSSLSHFLHFTNSTAKDLLDVRELLEVRIAELAAIRATKKDLVQMENALEMMENAGDDINMHLAGDLAFHSALAQATQSEVFEGIINSIVTYLFDVRLQGFLYDGPERGREDHRKIFEAVRAKNPGAAKEAMREHLIHVREDMERSKDTTKFDSESAPIEVEEV
jgi:GntR family transcriptional repressor for pyruvate dehydrogenase complex